MSMAEMTENEQKLMKSEVVKVWLDWEKCLIEADSAEDKKLSAKLDEVLNDQRKMDSLDLKDSSSDQEVHPETEWRERTGLDDDTFKGAIETIIFMSDKPISLTKIRDNIDKEIPVRFVHNALSELMDEYEKRHHGIRLAEVAEGFQFRTKAVYSRYVQNVFKVNSLVLTPSALEVLAIIAYKQPVSRVEIDRIRGVDSSHIVRTLMDKRLIKVVGRSEELGKPTIYGTTAEFLEVFNLSDIGQLPNEMELEELAKKESIGSIDEIKTFVGSNEKGNFFFDELDEIDELQKSIRSIKANTLFTKSLNVHEKKRVNEEGERAKSAFEILEDFVICKEIIDENKNATMSVPLVASVSPCAVSDFLVNNINAPLEEDEEEFEMIDLDTGEPIKQVDIFENQIDENVELEDCEETESIPVSVPDTDLTQDFVENEQKNNEEYIFSTEERESLAKKLDDVFDKFVDGESLKAPKSEEENSILEEEKLDLCDRKIEEVTENMLVKASKLNLNLDFLNDSNENNSNENSKLDQ